MVVSFPTPAAILIRFAAVIFLHAAYSAWDGMSNSQCFGLGANARRAGRMLTCVWSSPARLRANVGQVGRVDNPSYFGCTSTARREQILSWSTLTLAELTLTIISCSVTIATPPAPHDLPPPPPRLA